MSHSRKTKAKPGEPIPPSTIIPLSSPINTEKQVLVVSDLHVGSIYGLWPPDFILSDGRKMSWASHQGDLWRSWEMFLKDITPRQFAAVVINGDVIDGRQQAQWGTEAMTASMKDQRAAAASILWRLKDTVGRTVPMYFVQGTEYHDSKAGDEAEAVAEMLEATPAPEGIGPGQFSRQVINLEFSGTILNFSHGISVSGGLYRATSPDREGVWSALAGKEGKIPQADAVIRSHAHYYVHVEHSSKHIVITPCWELQTGYMRKHSVYRMLPDLGAVIVHVRPERKPSRDPIYIEKVLYDHPAVRTTILD